ncbi:MAG TPA: YqiA/YcfP family alpha/beta fold hydrolase [Bryobacteraceae bacterium]
MRVVYLHGFASSPASGKAQYFSGKFKAAGVDVSVPALDGGDFRNLTITSQLAIVERAVTGGPVVLMGSSLGGYLAALYTAAHPEQVERVILMAPAFCFARRWSAELAGLDEWTRRGVMEMFHYGEGRSLEIGFQLITDGLRYPDYPDVRQPALLLHGALDPVVPASLSEEFVKRHPATARLRVYPKSGHELSDVVDDMWTEVRAFCGGLLG